MKILFVGAEAVPFISTGGLGDVLGSLPQAIASVDKNADVRVVLPLYQKIKEKYQKQKIIKNKQFKKCYYFFYLFK